MTAPESIKQLVKRFDENREAYRSGRYNEAQLRVEFLNPFFEALGWDVFNKKGYALDYREVVTEDSIDIQGQAKAPDYAFKVGRERKFFVEAKKPSVDIAGDIHPAYQLRRYAWNVHLPLSILTDFEEFAVYDCRNRPNPSDSAATGRTMFFKYSDFVDHWDEIAGIFSREAVLKGSFDKYALENKGKKGTTEVDDAFLEDIEEWRTLLARVIALRNPNVADEQQLNYAVQMTIDRVIFLRICEDRGIEPEFQLQTIAKTNGIYIQLIELFKRADTRYNSGLFHFHAEKGQSNGADTFTPALKIDDKTLKEIINRMYYPCPYIFKEIPVEILGQVYEQFLGKVIRLTAGHQAKVEEKPEVRKAGGVYYTPAYIVKYIVENTLGRLLEGKTPAEAAELKLVDPACGSGSFLLGAYQYLLNWHEDWYAAHDPEQWAKGKHPALVQVDGGVWKLTTEEKKKILVNTIHGVDIDPQAVEVTKLSLLLKVLEEESGQLSLGFERVLPDLGNNIKCGNTLIGEDYFEGRLAVDENERRRVNPFDWQRAFPQVFSKGGFDAVIGNPPYIKEYSNNQPFHDLRNTYLGKYYQGKMDIWYVFGSLAIDLLKPHGFHSFIATNNWITNSGASKFRSKILSETCIQEFIDFGNYHVFNNVGIQTMIYIVVKKEKGDSSILYRRINNPDVIENEVEAFLFSHKMDGDFSNYLVSQDSLKEDGSPFTFLIDSDETLLQKIGKSNFLRLQQMDVAQGIVLPQDFVMDRHLPFLKDKSIRVGDGIFVLSRDEAQALNLNKNENDLLKPLFTTKELGRYIATSCNEFWVIYTDKQAVSQIRKFPTIKKHLNKFANIITSDNKPYGLHRARNENFFLGEKIISVRKTDRPQFTYTDFPCYVTQTFFVIKPKDIDLKYLTGILNSKVTNFWLNKKGKKQGDALQIDKAPILEIPIRTIDFTDPADVTHHERMVALVQRMLELHKQTPATPFEEERLQRQIQATDNEIDRLVYELYDLTPEEVKIVEGG